MLISCLRFLFFFFIVRPLIWIALGLNIRHYERLPQEGPAILIANHNSHIDTLALMSLYPMRKLPVLHPVAAADYFLRSKPLAWFSQNILGIIPIYRERQEGQSDPLAPVETALDKKFIIIFFPEGTRGEPEMKAQFKKGIAHLAKRFQTVPVIPIFIHGAGKALPKGEGLLVPFFIDIFIGEAFYGDPDISVFMAHLQEKFDALEKEAILPPWE